jgi:hypothetical protein
MLEPVTITRSASEMPSAVNEGDGAGEAASGAFSWARDVDKHPTQTQTRARRCVLFLSLDLVGQKESSEIRPRLASVIDEATKALLINGGVAPDEHAIRVETKK